MENTSSIFEQANQFYLPDIPPFDFFDFLAGQKLTDSQQSQLEEPQIIFKFPKKLPKPDLRQKKPKTAEYKPIKLIKVHGQEDKSEKKESQFDIRERNNDESKKDVN